MNTWVYVVTHNEAFMIRYWLRHYATFCSRIVIYDDNSDDGTQEIAQAAGAEVRPYPHKGLDDHAFVEFANEQYREARGRADWVIWVDADEFVYHPRITERLAELKAEGVTLPQVDGYNMLGTQPPSGTGQIYDEITMGFSHDRYCKPVVLDPELDLIWDVGKHDFWAPDAVRNTDDPLKLLHFRYLGREYHEQRSLRNFQRLSQRNRNERLGYETKPGWKGEYGTNWYEQQWPRAEAVV